MFGGAWPHLVLLEGCSGASPLSSTGQIHPDGRNCAFALPTLRASCLQTALQKPRNHISSDGACQGDTH